MDQSSSSVSSTLGWRLWAVVLCAIGAGIRAAAYAQHHWLSHDEAALALNLMSRGFRGLLAPLDDLQTAPPLFLWIERAVVLTLGSSEWALRIVPLLAGVATAPMMWRVGSRLLPPAAATLAVGLVALSPPLITYSVLVKSYAVDAFLTLLILDRTLAAANEKSGADQWWLLAATGVAAMAASTPALFALGGASTFLLATAVMERDHRLARRALVLAAAWGVALAVLLATVFRPMLGNSTPIGQHMQWAWGENFLTPDPPGLGTKILIYIWTALPGTFLGATPLPNASTLFAAAVTVGAAALIASRRLPLVLLLTVPFALLSLASMLRLYPIAERLILFAAPLSALLVAASQLVFLRKRSARASWISAAATVAILLLAARAAPSEVAPITLGRRGDPRLVLLRTAVREHARGVPAWMSGGAEAQWRYYTYPSYATSRRHSLMEVFGSRTLASGLIVGSWSIPAERIVDAPVDTVAAGRPSPWSENEARRIKALARPCVLLFLTDFQPGQSTALVASASALGGRVAGSQRVRGTELHYVCFDTHVAPGEVQRTTR